MDEEGSSRGLILSLLLDHCLPLHPEQTAPGEKIKELADLIEETFQLMPSDKHMVGKNLGKLELTPSLNHRALG